MRHGRWFALVGALGLVALRSPGLLLEPRLWAEEGSDFFAHAWHSSFLAGVFFVQPDGGGYFNLAASLPAAVAARAVELESVPALLTGSALIPLVLSISVILFGRSLVWNTPARQIGAIAILLFCPAATGEAWLNSINAQIYWGFASLCILCEESDERSPAANAVALATLAFAGLSGAYTDFLLPAFALKAWRERSPAATAAVAILGTATLIQAGAVAWSEAQRPGGARWPGLPADWPSAIAHTLYAQVAVPLVGRGVGRWIASPTGAAHTLGFVHAAILACLSVGVARLVFERRRGAASHLLLVGFASLAIGTTLTAQNSLAGGRYAVLSGFALLLLLMEQTRDSRAGWRRFCAGGVLAIALVIGAVGYRDDPAFACTGNCPRWSEEVAAWRADPTSGLRIWPQPAPGRWTVELEPLRGQRGTPPSSRGTLPFPSEAHPDAPRSTPLEAGP